MTVSLITGTSKGIGLVLAVELAKAGHDVYASMREPSRAGDLLEAAKAAGIQVQIVPLDVRDDVSVRRAIESVLAQTGRIDALINNAGIVGETGPVEFLGLDAYRDVMETNFYGSLRCMQAVLGHMRERGTGAIINVSATGGMSAVPLATPYSTSKFALEGITDGVARELVDTDVRVALIEPGFIYTPLLADVTVPPPPDPGSAYALAVRRHGAFLQACLPHAAPPERVAEVVLAILDGDTWRFRNPVGPDAERLFDRLGTHGRELPLAADRLPDGDWAAAFGDLYAHEIKI